MNGFNPCPQADLPLDAILCSGSDSRSRIDVNTRLNKYLCSLSPVDDVVPFGSCTASSVSPVGYQAIEEMYQRFLAVGSGKPLRAAIEENNENIRRELVSILTRGDCTGVELVLTPSGTDAELIALCLAGGGSKKRICNILIGPTEVGRGTANAASCLHFDNYLPSAQEAIVGEPVDEQLADRTDLCKIPIRTASGDPRDPDEIDQEVIFHIETAISQQKKVLLHVIAHSKTGIHAPSFDVIEAMRERHGEQLVVVVDAAQGRFSRRGLLAALKRGYLVIITGSKFFGGPFFSGGLLVPPQLNPTRTGLERFPVGFGNYITSDHLPVSWAKLRAGLPQTSNVGLSLRWVGALAEIRNYYLTPSNLRLIVLRAFENILPKVFGTSSHIQLLENCSPCIDDSADRFLQSKTTVFSFTLRKDVGARSSLLTYEQLSDVFRWINFDISSFLPIALPEVRRSLAPRHHIGQPVVIAGDNPSGRSILRVALGGVLIARIAADIRYGLTLDQRISWLEDQLISLKRKIETVTSHFDEIKAAERFREEVHEYEEAQPPTHFQFVEASSQYWAYR